MDDASIKRFEKQVALFSARPATKFAAIPWKLAWSTAIQKMCLRNGKIVSTKARTFWGPSMNVVLPEAMSCSIYRYGFLEEGLTGAFMHLLKPGMTVFDIGTHFGYFTMLASELVGPSGNVHSFEPTPSTFAVLQSNVAKLSNVHLNNCAVYCEEKTMEFQDFGAQFSAYNSIRGSRMAESVLQQATIRRCTVQAITVDGYVERSEARPDFIKIDAENAELDILKGAKQLLSAADSPIITLEVGPDVVEVGQSASTIAYLLQYGYRAFNYDVKRRALCEHAIQSKYTYDNVLMIPPKRLAAINAN